ncbi:hypothetical protein [Bosea lathyri]|uniref:hypothetical protein n=1 Tax=Bosea lathyri TaxID=1036778 RepID=UPI0011B03181|nr:hypothetical protein [Bosea lathyri]
MNRGSIATVGRDSPGIAASGGGSVNATGVIVTTSGTDNAMGVIADLDGRITFNGGSVTTSGNEVRAGARPRAFAARNPGGVLTSDGTILSTSGLRAMGVVADDGGIVNLTRGASPRRASAASASSLSRNRRARSSPPPRRQMASPSMRRLDASSRRMPPA